MPKVECGMTKKRMKTGRVRAGNFVMRHSALPRVRARKSRSLREAPAGIFERWNRPGSYVPGSVFSPAFFQPAMPPEKCFTLV